MTRSTFTRFPKAKLALAVALLAWPITPSAEEANRVAEAQVDNLFSKWTAATPGCAVGVSLDGKIVFEKAYGMADLEHDVPAERTTIFEAGSISKQFTAAAILLLVKEGKLSLDDPARKYIPELPDYGDLTIRHMLQHTSGLRDWGSIASIAGWPRTSRVHTPAHVLDIVGRQRQLNFQPGTHWSYSNTGYNLAAIIVSRVSGESFIDFTRKRIFEPLGMTRTSWRDDFTRVVKGRAMAYTEAGGSFSASMPFENVYGNGGLLTTVGDLLRWNENFFEPKVGDADFVRGQQIPGKLNSGQGHNYGFGLYIKQYKGLREVSHDGATAGYRAFLARYPDQHVSIAVLSNVSSCTVVQYAHAVADLYLGASLKRVPEPAPVRVPSADLDAYAGLYRNTKNGEAKSIVRSGDTLGAKNEAPFVALSPSRFALGGGRVVEFDGRGGSRLFLANGTSEAYEKVSAAHPTLDELGVLAGTYTSDEAEVTLKIVVRDGCLDLIRRPDSTFRLTPLYADAFSGELGTVIFRRDDAGRPIELSVVQDRVWDLRFRRQPDGAK